MTNYKLKRIYPMGLFINPFYAFNFNSLCYSHEIEFNLTVHQRIVPNIVGICTELRGARIYLFEDINNNIIFGVNDRCIFIQDISHVEWNLLSNGRQFVCNCFNPIDNIAIVYETNEQRWKNPLKKLEDVLIPDEEEILAGDLASSFTDLIDKKADMQKLHNICFQYYK